MAHVYHNFQDQQHLIFYKILNITRLFTPNILIFIKFQDLWKILYQNIFHFLQTAILKHWCFIMERHVLPSANTWNKILDCFHVLHTRDPTCVQLGEAPNKKPPMLNGMRRCFGFFVPQKAITNQKWVTGSISFIECLEWKIISNFSAILSMLNLWSRKGIILLFYNTHVFQGIAWAYSDKLIIPPSKPTFNV